MKLKERPEKSKARISEIFTGLYEANLKKLYRYIYYRVRDVNVTEDLTATVFEKALTKFNRYSADKASFSTWLFAIARNTLVDFYRKSSREVTTATEVTKVANLHSQVSYGTDEVFKNEELQRLFLYLSGLSDLEQEIISLKFGSGLTNREIARLNRLSESNVGTVLYRAIRKLRAKFLEDENG